MNLIEVLAPTPENIKKAARSIRAGQVVGMPTETVYGLAGNAFDPSALTRIFETKERPTFDPLIVHVACDPSLKALQELGLVDVAKLSSTAQERAQKLIQKFWPGPLTLVLPKQTQVPDLATSGLATVAIRMPEHPVAQALIREVGSPLAAPSANRFGRISPTSAQDVVKELGTRIPYVLDGGSSQVGVESTVLAVQLDGTLVLLRPGKVLGTEIKAVTGTEPLTPSTKANSSEPQASPGMLMSHYAPKKTLCILERPSYELPGRDQLLKKYLSQFPSDQPIGLLIQSGDAEAAAINTGLLLDRTVIVQCLSPSGKAVEAAKNLFACLRALDESQASVLLSEPCPSLEGLYHAIFDRLSRAGRTLGELTGQA